MNKKIPKISLIIPVYNVQEYIEKALQSVANQTFKDFEVIIVNDGSKDQSVEIAKKFINKYDNFKLINQENQGLSAARNTGLREAKGEYIAFIDSDDFIESNFLEELYHLSVDNDADISYCNYKIYYPKMNWSLYMPFASRSKVYSKQKALKTLILDVTLHYYAWNKLYKRTLFTDNNIEFPDMFFEDIATTPRLLYFANKCAVSSKGLYHYTRRKGSILSTMNVKKVNDYTTSLGIIRNFIDKQGEYDKYKTILKIYGLRVMLVNYYSIFDMHFREMNFNGMATNIKRSNESIKYFVGENYKTVDDVVVKMPYEIQVPPERVHPKKKEKKTESSVFED